VAILFLPKVEITTAEIILDKIKQQAIAQFSEEKWIAGLVREYVKLAKLNGDDNATAINRRPQIERAFREGSCTLSTAILLAAAVNCKFQLSCTETRIINL
jgi:hypothetical protein